MDLGNEEALALLCRVIPSYATVAVTVAVTSPATPLLLLWRVIALEERLRKAR